MKLRTEPFGLLPNGAPALLFTLDTENGLAISITNYGGIITSIKQANRSGNMEEITAGFSNLAPYLDGHPHFGAIIGRYANRIANGCFAIGGKTYNLPINNPPNHLHGGFHGFHTKLWEPNLSTSQQRTTLTLRYHSPHLEEGYPGALNVVVAYSLSPDNTLQIEMKATTDQKTHVNLTSHCYFNLNGFRKDIGDHTLRLAASKYLPSDSFQIPTGQLASTKDTPFDLSTPTAIRSVLGKLPSGLDHCFVLDRDIQPAATLHCPASGRKLTITTSQPALQVYTANSLDGRLIGHGGIAYQKHGAICLEPQHFPNAPNQPEFPTTLVSPGNLYQQNIILKFGTE